VIILFVFLAAIAFALVRGGRLANLANIRLRFFYLLFAPLVLQLLAFSPFGANLPRGVPYIYLCSLLVGGIVVWFNRSLPGFPLLFAGLLCNLLVITLNGGFMPVKITYVWDENGQTKSNEHIAKTPADSYVIKCGPSTVCKSVSLEIQ